MPLPAAARITLDQWRALVAVVEAGGYARAAATLHKSQSTVSYAVQQIGVQLGAQVFRVEGRRARLTPAGELLYRRARYLLDEAAALESASRRFSAGWEAQIRLAVEVVFPTWLLLACLDRFGKESPDTHVEVTESVLGYRTDVLASGAADLAVFGSVPAGFLGEPLMRVRFVLAAHPGHPLFRLRRTLTPRDLRPHRHLLLRESSPDRPTEPSLRTTQRWTVGQIATSIAAARAGYGFAWLPEDLIRPELQAGTLRPLPLAEGAERFADLYLVFADREHAGPGTRRLAQILREAVASECAQRVTPGLRAAAAPARGARRRTRGS
jgi:DNA-binding transcriptional LysR family regulator